MTFLRKRLLFFRNRSAFWWSAYLVGTTWAIALLVYFASHEEWLWFALFLAFFFVLPRSLAYFWERRFRKDSGLSE